MKALLGILICANLFGLIAPWSYEDQSSWPGMCNTGRQQSPIDISTNEAILDRYGVKLKGPLVFKGHPIVNVTAINNGHTLKWRVNPASGAPTISGGPLNHEYTFIQFHLHWISEHAIDGLKYPLEIHIVHRRSDLTVEEATLQPDGLAVIGVFAKVHHESAISSKALSQIMPDVRELVTIHANSTRAAIIDLSRLLSPQPQSYYTYQGSLTTPECQEIVTWIVMDQPLIISDTQYKQIRRVNVGGVDNFRALQVRNRKVYRSIASCSSMLAPGAVGLLSAAFSCMTSNVYYMGRKGYCALVNLKKKVFGGTIANCY